MARSELWRGFRSWVRAAEAADRLGLDERAFLDALEARRDPVTRREFVRLALGAAASTAASAACAGRAPRSAKPTPFYPSAADPVAVVGGGLSGLTCAYRLTQAGVPVVMYESSPSRLGGRTWTLDDFGAEGRWIELGGEFIDTGHEALRSLARELGLTVDRWTAPGDEKLEQTLYWFGGVPRYERDLALAAREAAARIRRERKAVFGDRPVEAISCYDFERFGPRAGELDRMSLAEWLDRTDFGSNSWARQAIDACFVAEYGRETSEQSALNLIAMCDGEVRDGVLQLLGDSDMSWRVRGGNDKVAAALASSLKSQPALFKIETGARLARIKDSGSSIRLSFDRDGGGTLDAKASRVVLALPFSCLRDVEGTGSLDLDPRVDRAVRRMSYGTCSKFAFATSDRPWRRATASRRAVSGSVVHERPSQQFWDSSRHMAGVEGIVMNYCGGRQGERFSSSTQDSVVADFAAIFPEGASTVHPSLRASMNWTAFANSKGAFSQWAPGDYESIAGASSRSQLGGRLLFAGEHSSVRHAGYMNGAVDAGERAARELLSQRT